jgi:hypothetical protein
MIQPLNIAEGAGEYAGKDKANFYRFAQRSAAECAAVIEIAAKLDPSVKNDEEAKAMDAGKSGSRTPSSLPAIGVERRSHSKARIVVEKQLERLTAMLIRLTRSCEM